MSRAYRVFRSLPSDQNYLAIFRRTLNRVTKNTGYEFNYALDEEFGGDLIRHAYIEFQKRALLTIVDDHRAIVRYLIIEAEDTEKTKKICSTLDEQLSVYSLAELQEEALTNMMRSPNTLIKLALGTDITPDSKTVEILMAGLQSIDKQIRVAASEAAGITQWLDFAKELEILCESDPAEEVRVIACRALNACKRLSG